MKEVKRTINLNYEVYNELGNSVGTTVALGIAGGFNRFLTRDEHVIRKVDVFVRLLTSGKPFELDEADLRLFKEIMLQTDSFQIFKIEVLKVLDQVETQNRKI